MTTVLPRNQFKRVELEYAEGEIIEISNYCGIPEFLKNSRILCKFSRNPKKSIVQ
jgi:hypothetical protein